MTDAASASKADSTRETAAVNIRPGVGILGLFPAMNYKAWYALGELVDNAIDSYLMHKDRLRSSDGDGYQLRVVVDVDGSNDSMIRVWDNAAGIDSENYERAFVTADPPIESAGLSEFGIGMKSASLVLLGDPNQLPQVSQGSHPPGAEVSVLGHLLGSDATVRPGMGIFLERTWRMRPEVNAYVSETFYEGRLEPAPVTSERSVADGNGVRFLPVDHVGHSQAAPEEADAIRAEIERLVGTPYVEGGAERPLRYGDFIVVAPYNAHVRCLREKLPEAVRIGTVDKFQGQEATVSFFSMASSSGEDVPRGLDFLFSSNRLNVAVSRARCLAYVVASPRLLDANPRTVEQMQLINALCRFAEFSDAA
jgi:hypothetical protein